MGGHNDRHVGNVLYNTRSVPQIIAEKLSYYSTFVQVSWQQWITMSVHWLLQIGRGERDPTTVRSCGRRSSDLCNRSSSTSCKCSGRPNLLAHVWNNPWTHTNWGPWCKSIQSLRSPHAYSRSKVLDIWEWDIDIQTPSDVLNTSIIKW